MAAVCSTVGARGIASLRPGARRLNRLMEVEDEDKDVGLGCVRNAEE